MSEERKQVSMVLPVDLISYMDGVAGGMGISRQKLMELVLLQFRDMQQQIDDPDGLFQNMTKGMAQRITEQLQREMRKAQ